MRASRAPWWLYILAASFLGFFALQVYSILWGPEDLNLLPDYSRGSMTVQQVFPNGAGERAGLRAGDRIVAVDGVPLPPKRPQSGWFSAYANFEAGRPIPLEIEREGKRVELTLNLRRASEGNLPWLLWNIGGGAFTLSLALVIAFRRFDDPIARVAAWLLAGMALFPPNVMAAWASAWRDLPTALSLILWPASITLELVAGIGLTFVAIFPRKLFQARWLWILIWTPIAIAAALKCLLYARLVYRSGATLPLLEMIDPLSIRAALSLLLYIPASLVVWAIQYRRVENANEKRRMRILFAGLALSALAGMLSTALGWFIPTFSDLLWWLISVLSLAGPIAFAYAVLRHRVFDLRLIVRRGLQYALARQALVSAVPILAVTFIADLFLHGDQPILTVFRERGWVYAALAALAAVAYAKRQSWLEALDRRFFREQYDARRLLREVVEEVHAARSFEEEAPRVVTRVESALHPEFVALLVSEPREQFYRTLVVVPEGTGPPALKKESKLLSLIRLLGKPLEVTQAETGWLQQQLPHEETECLRRGRIDLLVPVATDPQRTEALLVLGVKRSEEPYSSEDQDLLVAVAASLAILLDRPATTTTLARTDIFGECPQCGLCYDNDSTLCNREGARLVPVVLPRLLEGRYQLERRLGRGGMGTVYSASDELLDRRVAVKVIREDLVGSAEAADRFRREARAAASFAHANVVTVHDFGVASGTRAFLVMEMLEGVTLRERLRLQKRLSTAHLLSIVRDVCAALSAAHRRHLVHRDLKPENVFLVTTEPSEIAKVLDFGIAKFLPNCVDPLTAETATSAILGTLRYMSPEQRSGQAVHHAWDLWALAVMTYEVLTGSYPFEDSSYDWLTPGRVVPFIPVNKHLPQASKGWQVLFERSFARDLSDRHDSPEAFLSELQCAGD